MSFSTISFNISECVRASDVVYVKYGLSEIRKGERRNICARDL